MRKPTVSMPIQPVKLSKAETTNEADAEGVPRVLAADGVKRSMLGVHEYPKVLLWVKIRFGRWENDCEITVDEQMPATSWLCSTQETNGVAVWLTDALSVNEALLKQVSIKRLEVPSQKNGVEKICGV